MIENIGAYSKVDYNRGYQQGRVDAEKDFQNSDEWNDYLDEIKKQIRADAIQECINAIKERWIMYNVGVIKAIIDVLESLKERINEQT